LCLLNRLNKLRVNAPSLSVDSPLATTPSKRGTMK
jgi:hypothetical protein